MTRDPTAAAFGAALAEARAALRRAADPAAAPIRKTYLKSPFEVLGCTVPVVRAAAKAAKRACPAPDRDALVAGLRSTWASPVHDDKLLAIMAAALHVSRLGPEQLDLVHEWLRDCRTWDHTDTLSLGVLGELALRHPEAWPRIERWAADPHLWVRRASLLAHIPAIRLCRLEAGRLQRTCAALAGERAFFIRKAIGWTLRELSTRDPDMAESILLSLPRPIAPLTLRETTRRMPAAQQNRLRDVLS
jgi:3-methyladenine DNA glycosylase AlkD